jgi:hypothetical protein
MRLKDKSNLLLMNLLTLSKMSQESIIELETESTETLKKLLEEKRDSGVKLHKYGKDTKMPGNLRKITGNTPKQPPLVLGNLTTHHKLLPNGKLLIKLVLNLVER